MSNLAELEFAQLLASRICHDLISPISAVNNGLELLEDDDDKSMQEKAMELITQSAKLASAKLQIMRAAFGAGQTLNSANSASDINDLISVILQHNNIILNWVNIDNDVFFTQDQARFILNMLMIACESLPRGGEITINCQNGFSFTLSSAKIIFSEEKEHILLGKLDLPKEPRMMGICMINLLLQKLNINCSKIVRDLELLEIVFE